MIEIKSLIYGKVLHSGDFESVEECLLDAIKNDADLSGANLHGADLYHANLRVANLRGADLSGANLSGANLYHADLYHANLRGANLRDANLRVANLRGANLRGANLRGADLSGANLYHADLYHANLRGANLRGCVGNRNEIRSLFISSTYPITYTSEVIQIGCENHKIEDWWQFTDKKIIEMDGKKALKFWRENKDFIKMTIEKFPATPTAHKESQE